MLTPGYGSSTGAVRRVFRADSFAIAAACLGLGELDGRMSIERQFLLQGRAEAGTRFEVTLRVTKPLRGALSTKGDLAGALKPRIYLGQLLGAATVTGREKITKPLRGSPAGVGVFDGHLRFDKDLSGSPAGLGVSTARLLVDRMRAAPAVGQGTLAGAGTFTKALKAWPSGVATASIAQPILVKNLSGTPAGLATIAGQATTKQVFGGASLGTNALLAQAIVTKALQGSISGEGRLASDVTTKIGFFSDLIGFSTVKATISVAMGAGFSGVGALTGRPVVVQPLTSPTSEGQSAVSGGLTIRQAMKVAPQGVGVLTGEISFGNYQATESGFRRIREEDGKRMLETDQSTTQG